MIHRAGSNGKRLHGNTEPVNINMGYFDSLQCLDVVMLACNINDIWPLMNGWMTNNLHFMLIALSLLYFKIFNFSRPGCQLAGICANFILIANFY